MDAEHLGLINQTGRSTVNLPFWHVLSWEQVEVPASQFSKAVRHMKCLGVSVRDATPKHRRGEVLWGSDVAGHGIGIAWEWGEAVEGVVAMVDPLTILTNVKLVTDDGVTVSADELLLRLNGAVNSLRWQAAAVRRAKEASSAHAAQVRKRKGDGGLHWSTA